jgi:hypothetical protein
VIALTLDQVAELPHKLGIFRLVAAGKVAEALHTGAVSDVAAR